MVAEAVPLHLSLRNRTSQFDFSLAYPDDFPISPARPALDGDLFANLKIIWSKNRNLMHAHSSSRSPPLTVAGSSRRHCHKPDTWEAPLLPRRIHTGSHRHCIDILRERLCFLLKYVPSPSSPPELPQRPMSSSHPYFSSITEPGPRSGRNIFLLAPHTGHFHSSGKEWKLVPLGILPFLSPRSGSYRQPQFIVWHWYVSSGFATDILPIASDSSGAGTLVPSLGLELFIQTSMPQAIVSSTRY